MKTRLSRGAIWTWIIVGLCIACFIVVPAILGTGAETDPHAGHNHANQSSGDAHADADSHGGHNHADKAHNKPAVNSYQDRKMSNGTYTYTVISRSGHTYAAQHICMTKPTATAVSNDIVKVSGQNSTQNNLSTWAIYYDVASNNGEGIASNLFERVLVATDNKVAYLQGENGQFSVVVCDPFKPSTTTVIDLPGLSTNNQTKTPDLTFGEPVNGVLKVSYTVGDTQKVIDIPLN